MREHISKQQKENRRSPEKHFKALLSRSRNGERNIRLRKEDANVLATAAVAPTIEEKGATFRIGLKVSRRDRVCECKETLVRERMAMHGEQGRGNVCTKAAA